MQGGGDKRKDREGRRNGVPEGRRDEGLRFLRKGGIDGGREGRREKVSVWRGNKGASEEQGRGDSGQGGRGGGQPPYDQPQPHQLLLLPKEQLLLL